jgi:hypothetical protein
VNHQEIVAALDREIARLEQVRKLLIGGRKRRPQAGGRPASMRPLLPPPIALRSASFPRKDGRGFGKRRSAAGRRGRRRPSRAVRLRQTRRNRSGKPTLLPASAPGESCPRIREDGGSRTAPQGAFGPLPRRPTSPALTRSPSAAKGPEYPGQLSPQTGPESRSKSASLCAHSRQGDAGERRPKAPAFLLLKAGHCASGSAPGSRTDCRPDSFLYRGEIRCPFPLG